MERELVFFCMYSGKIRNNSVPCLALRIIVFSSIINSKGYLFKSLSKYTSLLVIGRFIGVFISECILKMHALLLGQMFFIGRFGI